MTLAVTEERTGDDRMRIESSGNRDWMPRDCSGVVGRWRCGLDQVVLHGDRIMTMFIRTDEPCDRQTDRQTTSGAHRPNKPAREHETYMLTA